MHLFDTVLWAGHEEIQKPFVSRDRLPTSCNMQRHFRPSRLTMSSVGCGVLILPEAIIQNPGMLRRFSIYPRTRLGSDTTCAEPKLFVFQVEVGMASIIPSSVALRQPKSRQFPSPSQDAAVLRSWKMFVVRVRNRDALVLDTTLICTYTDCSGSRGSLNAETRASFGTVVWWCAPDARLALGLDARQRR